MAASQRKLSLPLLLKALTWTVGAEGAAPARPASGAHRYQACRDRDCYRLACLAYREGLQDGWDDCWPEAWQAGYAAKTCPGESGG